MSFYPEAFAKEIAYSRYISEVNGDNREAYRKGLVSLCGSMKKLIFERGYNNLNNNLHHANT